jgi:hypothetical protein
MLGGGSSFGSRPRHHDDRCRTLAGGSSRDAPRVSSAVMQLMRAAHSHPRSRAVAAASVRLRAPNLAIADER